MTRKKSAANAEPAALSYQERVLDEYMTQFQKEATFFGVIMFGPQHKLEFKGPGIECIHMLDCLRSLQTLYYLIAAHRESIRVAKGELR